MTTSHPDPGRLTVDYHDGRSEQAQAVSIWVSGDMLELAGHGILRQIPIHQVQWPETAQPEMRVTMLPGGGTLRCADHLAWDAWQQRQHLDTSLPSTRPRQSSWRWSLTAALLLLAICAASYVLALPPTRG